MIDADNFKSINDNYGHSVGDRVIQQLAETLRGGLRTVDIVGRYGGEEFCVLLPRVDIEKAAEIAERLREQIEIELKLVLDSESERVITASLGLVSTLSDAKDIYELVEQADQALYASKNNGRNRVTRWDELKRQQVA